MMTKKSLRCFIILKLFVLFSGFVIAEIQSNSDTIEVFVGKTKSVEVMPFNRILSMNPIVATVFKNSNTNITIKAGRVGEASVILWGEQRKILKIKVIRPEIVISDQSRKRELERINSNAVHMKIEGSFDRLYEGDSFSSQEQNNEDIVNGIWIINSPLFKGSKLSLRGSFEYDEEESFVNELRTVGILNIPWIKKRRPSLFFGKVSKLKQYAPLTDTGSLDGFLLDSLQLYSGEKGNITVNMTAGEEVAGDIYSSYSSGSFSRASQISLGDNKPEDIKKIQVLWQNSPASYRRNDSLRSTLALEYATTSREGAPDYFGIHSGISKGRYLLSGSIGGESGKLAHNLISAYQFDNLKLRYKRIVQKEGATSPSQGGKGNFNEKNSLEMKWALKNDYRPQAGAKFETRESEYLDELEKEQLLNTYFRIQLAGCSLGLNYLYRDETESFFPNTSDDLTAVIRRSHNKRLIPFSWSLRYSKSSTEYEGASRYIESDYYSALINFKLLKNLRYSLNYSNREQRRDFSVSDTSNSERLRHSINHDFNIPLLKARASIGLTFSMQEDENDVRSYFRESSDYSLSFSFSSNPTYNSKFKFNVSVNSSDADTIDNGISENEKKWNSRAGVYFSQRFYTLFGWKPKTEIDVLVFYDRNANGQFDGDDMPIEDVDILLNGEKKALSDVDGKAYLGKIRSFSKEVAVDRSSIPKGYVFSTKSIYKFDKMKSSKETCLFGLVINTEISGYLFNDLNGDGVFQDTEPALSGINISLEGVGAQAVDLNGRFTFSPVPEGELELKVDPFSIPKGYRSGIPLTQKMLIQKGALLHKNFPFKAARSLKINCFLKEGRKNHKLKGVSFSLNDAQKTTKKKGRVKFKGLKAGKHLLTVTFDETKYKFVSISGVQETLDIKQENPLQFELYFSKSPENKELNIYFAEENN